MKRQLNVGSPASAVGGASFRQTRRLLTRLPTRSAERGPFARSEAREIQ